RSNALGPLRCRRGTVQLHPHLVEVPDGFVAACGDELGSEVVACEGVEPQLQAAGLADALLSEVEQKRLEIAAARARSDEALARVAEHDPRDGVEVSLSFHEPRARRQV